MSKLKHTPGPWRTCDNGECKCGFVYGPEYIVAVTQQKYDDIQVNRETFEANARLIAAAPEMLEALIKRYKVVKKYINDAVEWNFGYVPNDDKYYDIIETEYHELITLIESATGLSIEEVLK